MKKNSKILILGLGLSLAFAPINSLVSSNINVAYAVEENTEKEEITLEEYIDQAKKFMDSDVFKKFEKDDQDNYKELLENLSVENLEKEKSDEIVKEIEKIKLSYEYNELKDEVLKLNVASLSDDLKKEVKAYKDSDETYKDYETQINKLKTIKSNIENYNKELAESKKILKEGLDKYKNSGLDLKAEKAVLDDEKSKLDDIEKAINSLNKKVEDYNAKVKEENRLKNLSKLRDIIDEEESVKNSYLYKKAGKELKEKFDASLENAKSAYKNLEKKEEVNNVDDLVSVYNSSKSNLDGNKFVDEHKKLIEYFDKNKDKLSGEDQEKFAKLINELPNKEDSNLESISKLKSEIEKAIEENQKQGKLNKVTRQVAVPKGTGTKKSRSFVRTGVKSVGIVLVVLILAGIAYFFATKKSKNNK
ncbi:hypothetical protein [Anaerococcus jeddahensis]|uniref:hypothetical protein n=1 Tax=Anaerococcus jeddahensis TaxID=1673719 RepID=UPI0006723BF3|nr:hypothetical protein [Anaerococcus jeddahensis]